jgi:flagellar M-ring protein FliF
MAPPTSPNRFAATVERLTPIQKIALGAAGLTVVAGALVFTQADGSTPMAPVYTDLEARDAAAITDELIAQGVEYELADGGRTVLVPREDVYDLRVSLSADGLPGSSEGYALLDEQGITTSEFRQRIDYQRALEGELARTLRAIDGVESVTVHLALPEESVFVDEPTDPTASVLVKSEANSPITSDQVAAMVRLVASSVKGMEPKDVTIADASGVVLAAAGESADGLPAGGRSSDAAVAFENELAADLRAMVGRVTGGDKVAVTVQADLDLTQRESTSERFDSSDADAGVVIAERTATETYSGTEAVAETGVLGPDGATVTESAPGSANSYAKDDAERTYAVNRTVESTKFAAGTVERLHVAVLVDEATVSEEQASMIEEMVSTAAGIDAERGDRVTVTRLQFDTSLTESAADAVALETAAQASQARNSLIRTIAISAIALIALLLGFFSARRARREVSTPIDVDALRAAPAVDGRPDSPATTAMPKAPSIDPSMEALDELSALADRRPEDVAQILQSWLADEPVSS